MIKTMLGKKHHMSSRFNQAGERIPVTCIVVEPGVVTQVKTDETDGYWAVQIGSGQQDLSKATKPIQGIAKKAGMKKSPRFLFEATVDSDEHPSLGDTISVSDVFEPGDIVSVKGTSKGRGFAGVIKRWGFSAQPRTHGQSDRRRAPGSIGQTTDPGRVWPGKKMAGRMGTDTVVVKNLVVQAVRPEDNVIEVKGAIPGTITGRVMIVKIGQDAQFVPLVGADVGSTDQEGEEYIR